MSSEPAKILIFDDRRKAGPLAEIILATGMQPEITSVIARGVELCNEIDFQVVIVDTDFNRGVGIDFITALRDGARNQFTPILAMSRAKPQNEIRSTTEAHAAGADEFLKRPIKRAKVLGRLTKLLGQEVKILERVVTDTPTADNPKKEKKERSQRPSSLTTKKKPTCLLYTSPSPRDATLSRMPSSA